MLKCSHLLKCISSLVKHLHPAILVKIRKEIGNNELILEKFILFSNGISVIKIQDGGI